MYHGKNCKKKRKKSMKSVALVVSLILLLAVGTGGAIMFLVDDSEPLENLFDPSKITTEVVETFKEGTKSDVTIKNTGDTTAWIRAAVVITWQDKDGNVYGQALEAGKDYFITYDLGKGWIKGDDGFYYWREPVEPGKETGVLIKECKYLANAPEDYALSVEILGSGIQSTPISVFNKQWESSGLEVGSGLKLQAVSKGGQ